jgi:glutamate dehydrogenase
MTATTEQANGAVVDSVCARVRECIDDRHAGEVEEFVRQFYRWVPPGDLAHRSTLDLYGAAVSAWNLLRARRPGEVKVRVYNPRFEQHGWQSTHTAVEVVGDDMPFLVDSVSMVLGRLGYGIHLLVHPVLRVQRSEQGDVEHVVPAGTPEGEPESVIHVEVDRQTDKQALHDLRDEILKVLGDVRAAVDDWPAMTARTRELAAELEAQPESIDAEDRAEAKALLEWLVDDHFAFLGYREYDLESDADGVHLCARPDTGLGLLRNLRGSARSEAFDRLPERVRALAGRKRLLVLTKANARSTVHRPAYLDYVAVKRFDDEGNVVGERRFLGLYTSSAYKARPRDVPLLRRKIRAVLDRAGLPEDSHDQKALVEILESLPKDELFQIGDDGLFDLATGILALGERRHVRLFLRRDEYERFLSCFVYLPRDRFNTQNRERIADILADAVGAQTVDFGLRLTESVLVRIHFLVRVNAGELPDVDVDALEQKIVEVTRTWNDALLEALLDDCGEESGNRLFRRYRDAFTAAYQADRLPRTAVADVLQIEHLDEADGMAITLYRPLEAGGGELRCKLFKSGEPVTLSDVLPMFEHAGLAVADERPYEVRPEGGPAVWIYDFGLVHHGDVDVDEVADDFQDALRRVWRGELESDGLNALVLDARLTWRDTVVLRAVLRYLRQAQVTYSNRYMEQALRAHPDLAGALVELFAARFDPRRERDGDGAAEIATRIEEAIEEIESLDEDRILRSFLAVIQATLRTNHYRPTDEGGHRTYLSLKLDPTELPFLPMPRPQFEIFVYSPRTEGVHLRGGRVARGGLRWSDRREDFRTEVLGLMKAQMVKNALIVPVGAKGGFVVKQPPASGGRAALGEEVEACYRTFIRGLLDVTDNIVEGEVVPPPDVVRYDEDDTYLVVAADKGTATFSDIANAVAAEYDFWLGDAFASGGSAGYDHKAMGITARGAWESVKRHFRELGHDVQAEDFTVAGVGDMSGDVFGNGMLLSEHIRLVAAFDHRHVFLDPQPDAERSFAERRRLFEQPRSSWADYDTDLISEGGGVWPRTAKSIPLSPQAREALGTEDERLTPTELIRAILRAPVDLLWNGGIGTYVKASYETHAEVGDKTNDAVRVDASDLRCRVIGEGGNLGLTQRGRVEYALSGGRVSTDAIDNAGGVNCSDREVNIKVLLNSVVDAGDMTVKQRDKLLAEMTDSVADLVLRDNRRQAEALSLAEAQASSMLDVHVRLIRHLEQVARLDPQLEALPDAEAIDERRAADGGLTRPELAVLLAYSKISLNAALLDSDVPEDEDLAADLTRYFPKPLPERFGDAMHAHRLRREIVATHVTNSMVDRAGSTFSFRMQEDTGAQPADIARAYAAAREIYGMPGFWIRLADLDQDVSAEVHTRLLLDARRLIERSTRWLLRHRRRPLAIATTIEDFADPAIGLAAALPEVLDEPDREAWDERVEELLQAGVPEKLARRAASFGELFSALDIGEIAKGLERDIDEVASVYFRLGSRLHLHWLRDRVAALSRDGRWQAMARAALRDDLYVVHRELTADLLCETPEEGSIDERLDAWISGNKATIERSVGIIEDIRASGAYDLTTLPVALREVRALIHETSPVT